MPILKLKNGQLFNPVTQTFWDWHPYFEGKTIGRTKFIEWPNLPNEGEFVMASFCCKIEIRGKTEYANFLDFELINKGKRIINNKWIDFNEGFEVGKCYILKCEKNILYPNEFFIKKKFVIKK